MNPVAATLSFARRRPLILAAVIVAVTLLVYIPAMRGGFCWDDHGFLIGNKQVEARDGLRRLWLTTEAPDYFPLTSSVLWFGWRIWKENPAGYHVVNVLLHAASAVLLWRVLARLRVPGAWLAGLLFAVHPVAAASAAWITELKNTLPMALYLLAILAYLACDECGSWRLYGIALVLFLLALLAKTSVVMLPPVLLLCAWWRRGRISRRDILRSLPFFAVALAMGLVTVWFQWHNVLHGEIVHPGNAASRAPAAGWIVWFYLFKLLVPAGLCAIYPRWNVDGASVAAYLPLVLLLAGLAFLWTRRNGPSAVSSGPNGWGRAPLFALAYFILALLPVLGFADMAFMRFSLVADHLQYTAMIGVIAFAAAMLARLAAAPGRMGQAGVLAAVGCVAILSVSTWRRASLYGDEEQLWRDNVAKNSSAWLAWNNLGYTQIAAGHYDEALHCFDEVIQLKPDNALAFYTRAIVLVHMGRRDAALRDYERTLDLNPGYAQAYISRAYLFFLEGQYDRALLDCNSAVQSRPDWAVAYNSRGKVYAETGHLAEAGRDYGKAIELQPDYVLPYVNRGNARAEAGRFADAIGDYDQAIALKPDLPEAYGGRAAARYHIKEYAKARADLETCEKLHGQVDPSFRAAVMQAAGQVK